MKKKLLKIIDLILVIILIILLFKIVPVIIDYYNLYQNKENNIQFIESNQTINPNWDELKKINEDIVGILYIPNTNIYNIITQGKDNQYYLTHDIYKNENQFGSLFLDYQNSSDFSDFQNVISAHSVLGNNIMFSQLKNYLKKDFFEKNQVLYLLTPNGNYQGQIFLAKKINKEQFNYQKSINNQELENFKKTISENAIQQRNIDLTINDKILTLYTCDLDEGLNDDERILIYAKLKNYQDPIEKK